MPTDFANLAPVTGAPEAKPANYHTVHGIAAAFSNVAAQVAALDSAILLLDQKLFALEGRLEQLEAKKVKRPTLRAGESSGHTAV